MEVEEVVVGRSVVGCQLSTLTSATLCLLR